MTSDTWPTDPVWNDPSLINAGNEYEAADGVIYDDFNKIIKDLIYLKKYISKPAQLQKKTISITQNGSTIVKPDTDYDGLEEVNINTNITPVLEPLEVTPSKVEQVFLPDAGVDGYSNVTVKATPLEKNKVIVPTATPQTISPVSPNIGFDVISVDPIQLQNKQNVELAFTESSDYQNIYSDESKYMNWVQLKKPATLLPANIKKDVNIAGIVGTLEEGETLPAYTGLLRFASAPTISLSNNTLTITAVDNATSYAIYSNNALLTTITTTSVDLSTLITTAGTYTIYAIAKATGYVDSEKSNEVSYTAASGYSVTVTGVVQETLGSCEGDSGEFDTYIKANSTPASATDYDYKTSYISTETTMSNVNKIYIWRDAGRMSETIINGTSTTVGNSYSSATEITLTQNTTITAYSEIRQDPGGLCCFLPNTLVNTSNGKVKIEDIKVGDFVGCYDTEYRDYIYGNVTKVIKNTNITELATLELENGTKVQFNSYHPILTKEGWKSLTNYNDYPTLTKNDVMVLGEKIKSIRIETLDTPLIGYNLVVEPYNNFVIESRIVAEGSNN